MTDKPSNPQASASRPEDTARQIDAALKAGYRMILESPDGNETQFIGNPHAISAWDIHGKRGLRDHFAGQALIALIHLSKGSLHESHLIPKAAYGISDAMLKARAE